MGALTPNDYEGADSPSSTTASLLPPHVKAARIVYHYEQQEQQCYTCDQTGHFSRDCPVCLKGLKDKKGLNLKGVLNTGRTEGPQSSLMGLQKALLLQSKMRTIAYMAQEPDACAE